MAKEIKTGIYMADRQEEERREKFTLTPRASDEEPEREKFTLTPRASDEEPEDDR